MTLLIFKDKPRIAAALSLLEPPSMRSPSLLLLATLALTPSAARAQSVTFTNVIREGSPRAVEQPNGLLSRDQPLGARDCPCERWIFEGMINPPANARTLEWWIGTSATACATAINRYPAMNATCWPLDRLNINQTLPITANRFLVTIPARWIVDPLTQTCTPPPAISAGSNVYVTAMMRPPDDMVPLGTVPVTVSTTRPRTVEVVTASGAESSAIVEWQHVRTEDGGTSMVPENTAGYYVLCLPRVAGVDAGLRTTSCSATVVDGSSADASDDASDDASTMDASAGGGCGVESLPSNFDPNDDNQLGQYACSPLLSVGTSRYTVTGLANGTSYRFAVVAQDNAGTRSTPSTFTPCISPEEVTDFWERYRAHPGMTAAPGCSVPVAIDASKRGGAAAMLCALGALVTHRINSRRRTRRS